MEAGVGREEQYRVIFNGVDVERFAITPEPVPDRIVAVTRFAPPKRNDLLVDAFASIRRKRPQAELHIVGDGPDRGALERQIGELGVTDRYVCSDAGTTSRRFFPERLAWFSRATTRDVRSR